MKPSKQCTSARNKANIVLGLINRTLENKTNLKNLYKALFEPHLEYTVQAWVPYLKKDKSEIRIEGVQRRAMKLIPALRNKQYEERLEGTDPFTMSRRRSRGDLIQVY